jgi:putative ABC transport system ATP-binding protein
MRSPVLDRPVTRVTAAQAIDAVKVYGEGPTSVRALDSLTIDFEKNRFTALMGPSGSGKSTLLHCLAGLDSLTSGRIFLGDVEVSTLGEKERTLLRRESIGFIFQFFNLVPTLDGLENIKLPLALAGRRPDEEWLDAVIATLGIGERLRHLPSELSGGQQQRIAAARALVSRPSVIFADEPTGNLDSRAGGELLGFMRRVVHEMEQTIVMVTHDPVAAGYSDRVVFLKDGRLAGEIVDPTTDAVLGFLREMGS